MIILHWHYVQPPKKKKIKWKTDGIFTRKAQEKTSAEEKVNESDGNRVKLINLWTCSWRTQKA